MIRIEYQTQRLSLRFFMLMLVLGANFLVMFFGWEGACLCSYLLIGYWYEKKSASDAGNLSSNGAISIAASW